MRALSPTVAGIVLAAWAAVGVHAFVKVPYVSPVVNQSAYDVWRYNAWEFNAAPYLIPSCLNCSAAGGPTSSDVYFAHDPMDALAAAREAIGSGVAQLQVRSGKHSYTAVGATTTGAAVIDVSNLTFMGQVFQTSCPARDGTQGQEEPCTAIHVGPGLKLFNLYDGLAQQGYMFPGGTCPTVGVSGFTLGGGLGIWSRALGVAVDNVLGANVVVVNQTAPQGVSLTSVTPESDPELFRALRGAGNNNFGIVVNLTVRVDPVPNQVSRWRINYSNFTACRDKAFPLFEAGVTDSWSDTGAGPASVTVAFDIYDNGCAAIVSGFNMTAKALEDALQRRGWLAVDGASPDPSTGPDTQAWPTAVANSEGCDTVEACAKRVTTEIPDPRSPGRWQAFTSFQYAALTRGDREALFAAVHNTSTLAKGTFVVAIVDMLGGAVNVTARDLDTTFVHHTALYHVQILAYLGSDDYEASEQAWQWADGVLGALDVAAARTGRAPAGYRNYPSSRLPHANLRFYGDVTLEFLQLLRQKRDPNGVFAYNGGV